MRIFILVLMSLLATTTYAEESNNSLIVKGEKSAVLDLVRQSISEEFTPDILVPAKNRIGFYFEFFSFRMGSMRLRGVIYPWVEADINAPIAHQVVLEDESSGVPSIAPLPEEFKKRFRTLLTQQSTVKEVEDTTRYKPLNTVAQCYRKIPLSPELGLIKKKVSLEGASGITFAHLADTSKPTPDEKKAIFAWAEMNEHCYNLHNVESDYFYKSPDNQYNSDFFDALNLLIAKLYSGELTYGEFSKQRKALVSDIEKRIKDDLATNKALELRNREVNALESMVEKSNSGTSCFSSVSGNTVSTSCY